MSVTTMIEPFTISSTWYSPGFVKVCPAKWGGLPAPPFESPSPKTSCQLHTVNVVSIWNETLSGAFPPSGVALTRSTCGSLRPPR